MQVTLICKPNYFSPQVQKTNLEYDFAHTLFRPAERPRSCPHQFPLLGIYGGEYHNPLPMGTV